VNHFSLQELCGALAESGFHVQTSQRVGSSQVLIRAVPADPRLRQRSRVLVLSCGNSGNFGDRVGFHLINSVLPASAEVSHASLSPWNVPAGDFDLLVLGTGNSLFQDVLTDELLTLVRRVPRSIGIFGTQYRELLDRTRLAQVLDCLTIWFARYEDDILLYGRGRRNVVHLGDWLISAFPLTRWQRDETLRVGTSVWNDLPLDRTIQNIQQYRAVVSERLHPLLCALTSAERVAYIQQRELGNGLVSGMFRSMLVDVFGRAWPEDRLFEFDRDAVAGYRAKVLKTMAAMPGIFSELLGAPLSAQLPQ